MKIRCFGSGLENEASPLIGCVREELRCPCFVGAWECLPWAMNQTTVPEVDLLRC